MKKIIPILVLLMVITFTLTSCAPAATTTATTAATTAVTTTVATTAATTSAEVVKHSNVDDFTYVSPEGTVFDLNNYYKDVGVDCDVKIMSTGGAVKVPDIMTSPLPKADKKYKIGFSVYYTVDEVGAMILDTMKTAAATCGVELLVNDANYDQNAQNQAVEQWILEKVDGVIIAPCDFTGVSGALDALKEAGIPVITLNPPLKGETYSVTTSDCVEQGVIAGEMLKKAILDSGKEMKGTIVYQTLPFVHPNAATRAAGFKSVFKDLADVTIVELTGISPEEHYAAFEGAIQAYPDMLGAWGLYSSATIGMVNAKKAANRDDILISSVDNDKQILKGIFEGDIVGSACYSSKSPSNWTMSQMVNLLNGIDIPGVLYYPNLAVTKDNVAAAFEDYYPGKTLQDYIDGKVD